MSAKQQFLDRILAQIKSLQAAYDLNKSLPESMFEGLVHIHSPSIKNEIEKAYDGNIKYTEGATEINMVSDVSDDYGRNRRLVKEIVTKADRLLLKSEIFEEYKKLVPGADIGSVNNALFGLVGEGLIQGYRPTEFKIRGKIWGLTSWFIKDKPSFDYLPVKEHFMNKKLQNME